MRTLLAALMCVVLGTPTGLARPAAPPDVQDPPDAGCTRDRPPIADVLVCIDLDATTGVFHDVSQKYVDAFLAAGAATVATAATEVSGGSINFPPDLTADNYPVIVVLTSDNWYGGPNNIDATDEAALAAYLDTGGSLLFVGQDYMYGAHPDMNAPNPCYGFPRDYLGLDICYQDFDTPGPHLAALRLDGRSTEATLTGVLAWILAAMVIVILAVIVFPATGYILTDRATPTSSAGSGMSYEGQFASGDGVLIYNETRGFRTVWSGVELAGAAVGDFNLLIATLYGWLTYNTPVEDASWTQIKARYR